MSADGSSGPGDEVVAGKHEEKGPSDPYRSGRPKVEGGLTDGRARVWIALTALAFYALFVFRTSFTIGGTRYFVLFEDAMISMRYARHVADGHGFVWNIGEAPIEGFTNL